MPGRLSPEEKQRRERDKEERRLEKQKIRAEREAEKVKKAAKYKLAIFIIEKFVKKERIAWTRDLHIANKLIEAAPDRDFWEQLEKKFDCTSMVQLYTTKARNFLDFKYSEYIKNKTVAAAYVPEKFEKFEILDKEPLETDTQKTPAKPKSVLEFCKL